MKSAHIAQYIDHTLLKPEATSEMIERLCQEAKDYHFFSVCIQPIWVKMAAKLLQGSSVKTCTVIGFPCGATYSAVKQREAKIARDEGAQELDMVLQIGALKSKDYRLVEQDIRSVVEAAPKTLVKVILETCLLSNEEKRVACQITMEAGAHFVKTSTGFSSSGATVEDVRLMRQTVGPDFGIKASGGIRDAEAAYAMIKAGATRLGTSSGIAIAAKNRA